jgi:23S rRNA pseudouridine2605 synthase
VGAVRLQKLLADAGVASRRGAERLIQAGRVSVNGRPVAEPGAQADPAHDRISVDGREIGRPEPKCYVLLHKPAGYLTTREDPRGRPRVFDLVPDLGVRLHSVGRLDADAEGLLLLTNDGEWAERVLHPRFGVEREYALALATPLTGDQVRALRAGIRLDEGLARLAGPLRPAPRSETAQLAATLDPRPDPDLAWYRATLTQGWKRQLRRMFGALDAPIVRLVRVRIGGVRLGDLRSGRARALKSVEIRALAGADSRHRET